MYSFLKSFFFFSLISSHKYPFIKKFQQKTIPNLHRVIRSGPYQLYLTFRVQSAGWVKLIQKNRRKCDERSRRINGGIVESLYFIVSHNLKSPLSSFSFVTFPTNRISVRNSYLSLACQCSSATQTICQLRYALIISYFLLI